MCSVNFNKIKFFLYSSWYWIISFLSSSCSSYLSGTETGEILKDDVLIVIITSVVVVITLHTISFGQLALTLVVDRAFEKGKKKQL